MEYHYFREYYSRDIKKFAKVERLTHTYEVESSRIALLAEGILFTAVTTE